MTKEVITEPKLPPAPSKGRSRVTLVLVLAVLGVLVLMAGLSFRAASKQSHEALAAQPRGVTVVTARATTFREERRYVGVIEPWIEAKVGPEFLSSWVDTVLVRPGDRVKKGDVLATLDCRNASSNTDNAVHQARALEERQRAMASEAARLENLLAGGFVSANEIDQKKASAASNQAQLEGLRAQLRSRSLEVSDCTLRAPFAGEVSVRSADPGTFVRPGQPLVTVIDRHLYRVVFDVPEVDYPLVALDAPVSLRLLATGQRVAATISRRTPAAGASTRTLRLEVDLSSKDVEVPVGTSAEVQIEVGTPKPASELPLLAAKVRGDKATVFVVEKALARKRQVQILGERGGSIFVAGLAAEAAVVTEGRGTLIEGETVRAAVDSSWPAAGDLVAPRTKTTADVVKTTQEGRP